jgi:signal peptidase II
VDSPGLLLVGAAVLTSLLDQGVKLAAIRRLPNDHVSPISSNWGLRLSLNPQPGLVGLTGGQAAALWVATATAAPLALAIAAPVNAAVTIGLGMLVGGAASNLADRRLHGGVVDLIALRRWPPFNLADAAMIAGALLIASGLL